MSKLFLQAKRARTSTKPGVRPSRSSSKDMVRLEDRVYLDVRRMIVDRDLLPGERIIPDEIAELMAVSRTPVINALKRLSQDRLVRWVPRRGVFVRRFTKREMAEVFELREVLEGLAARRSAMRISDAEIAWFREAFTNLEVGRSPVATANFMELDWKFHERLLELAENDLIRDAATFISRAVFAMGLIRTIEVSVREHYEILDAFQRRDPKLAEDLMRAHIHRSVEWLSQEADEEDRRRPETSPAFGNGWRTD